uniref:Uncharacterized protein n=1 Tax=Anguilla anguilla TaxID=7936 RepID=A0A0E9UBL0_ANGAN
MTNSRRSCKTVFVCPPLMLSNGVNCNIFCTFGRTVKIPPYL